MWETFSSLKGLLFPSFVARAAVLQHQGLGAADGLLFEINLLSGSIKCPSNMPLSVAVLKQLAVLLMPLGPSPVPAFREWNACCSKLTYEKFSVRRRSSNEVDLSL